MSLRTGDFGAFHEAVHGRAPFPWQERLLRTIESARAWPEVLDLPTGSGKTTCIDVALFALALDAGRAPDQRWCARRIAMVVDRRVVVDQAADRGRLLLSRLTQASVGVVADVAAALKTLVGEEEEPLAVYTLRGGIARDDGWARTPHQPLILASTVDQLGSRLLLQGYGVSRSMKPVHAGLLANDTLVLLDEVHLSRPFAETLERLAALRSRLSRQPGMRPLQYALLSATPGGDTGSTAFRLERGEQEPTSPLGQRLHAPKPARLEEVKSRDDLHESCARAVEGLTARHAVTAVVMNRVGAARTVASAVRASLGDRADVVLLTGRMRPLDRDDVLSALRDRIATGRDRAAATRKLVVVATQCIEAGADFDFDALVTESASLDALRQRFGRLDRIGAYGHAEGVVLHVRENAKDDPIYGEALSETWKWLLTQRSGKQKRVDFGIAALPEPADAGALLAPRAAAPSLLPAYLDLWSQTSPEPAVVPDVALFLHGPRSGPPDVQVVWRADLLEEHLARDDGSAAAIVEALRPSSLEAVSLPFNVARSWLAAQHAAGAFPDVEGAAGEVIEEPSGGQRALRWRGAESAVIETGQLRPGDTIVVPALRGGLTDANFDPSATAPVTDLAERAALLARGRPVLRLHPVVLQAQGLGSIEDSDEVAVVAGLAAAEETLPWRRVWLRALSGRHRRSIVHAESGDPAIASWVVVEARRLSASELRAAIRGVGASIEAGSDTTSDEDDSFHLGLPGIELGRHSARVERYAREYAKHLGLASDLASDLALAAWLHDVGKADPRFQLMLRGGDEIELLKDDTPWAKSSMPTGARQAHELARRRARYPRGARHEVQSVAMIEAARESVAEKAHDLDLVLHLVGSHHGHCRPFAPATIDEKPVAVSLARHASEDFGVLSFVGVPSDHGLHRLDSPLADRFWSLVSRYGWLELCWLEAILRLADHRASEAEQREGEAE
jgi:CRISPR-associated endonuclease/helicase Cas3